jgi:glycosyltransferase involved in cell wall biosynthesis
MSLTVLSVAFCLTTVGPGSVGGAEQVLLQIDEGLVRRGHRSLVIAGQDSRIAGTLIPTRSFDGPVSHHTWYAAHDATRKAIAHALAHYPVDLVHMHGNYFADLLPPRDFPTLITLHLPLSWYKPQSFRISRPHTFFQCVSRSQRESFPAGLKFLPDIENGVASELIAATPCIRKKNFVAMLGRICPEKAFHIGLRAARQAHTPALLAGRVFPFDEHQRYFAEQIRPELDSLRRYIGPIGPKARKRLLASARCVIVPSVVPETSSLVAREAIACATPVVAFANGALPEIIQHGKTGFLVRHESELPAAIHACSALDSEHCRRAADELFSADAMVESYIATYQHILELSCRKLRAAS